MKALIKPLLFSLSLGITTGILAQDEKDKAPEKKDGDVIIRKKGDSKEKMTIVIDGDKVTINGKPAEDYKNDDIEILHDGDMFMPPMAMAGTMAPGASFNVMNDDF